MPGSLYYLKMLKAPITSIRSAEYEWHFWWLTFNEALFNYHGRKENAIK